MGKKKTKMHRNKTGTLTIVKADENSALPSQEIISIFYILKQKVVVFNCNNIVFTNTTVFLLYFTD